MYGLSNCLALDLQKPFEEKSKHKKKQRILIKQPFKKSKGADDRKGEPFFIHFFMQDISKKFAILYCLLHQTI